MEHIRKRGKKTRGGQNKRRDDAETVRQKDIHSRIAGLPSGTHKGHAHNLHGSSATAAIAHAAQYFEAPLIEERAETHVIPRQSITRKQLLGVFPQQLEFAPRVSRQLDKPHYKRTGEIRMIEVVDQRLAWKSDKTLLRRGNPFKDAEEGERAGYKREGKVSVGLDKRAYTESIPNPARVEAEEIGPALDDLSIIGD